MNLFQWLVLPALGLLLILELAQRRRGGLTIGFWLLRCMVWVGAAVAIAWPQLVQDVASAIGIGTGTNLVLYLFVFVFLGTSFYFYSRNVLLQRQITQLTRHLAIREARHGADGGAGPAHP